jgi:acetolactate synthase I/II/III large subunit
VTKWSYRLTDPAGVPEIVALAVRKALSAPPGPVLLEVPIDVTFSGAARSTPRTLVTATRHRENA